jgi:hypothetical protein
VCIEILLQGEFKLGDLMTKICSVCNHKDIEKINELIVSGDSQVDIAQQFGLSEDAISRHKLNHLPELLLKSQEAKDIVSANRLKDQLEQIREKALELLDKAEQQGALAFMGHQVPT